MDRSGSDFVVKGFQLILLPGLGADHRLLEPQRAAFPQLVVPPWIPPRKRESLPQYAARMAETVTPSRDVPLILGGVSFGGMLAYEMARYLKPDAVVLIASCRTRRVFVRSMRRGVGSCRSFRCRRGAWPSCFPGRCCESSIDGPSPNANC